MRQVLVFLCAVWVIGAGQFARADDSPVISKQPRKGTFKMRRDLVGKHPRLHFTQADIPAIRRFGKGEGKFYTEAAKKAYRGYLGKDVPDEMPGWKRYLYGFWGLFTWDMLYVVEEDPRYAETAKKWALQVARQKYYLKDDIAPMDTLTGMSLTYDILYDQFTEAERTELRQAIYDGAAFIQKRFFVQQYWTRDAQNNHMHSRIQGLAHAAFAIYGDDPKLDTQPMADLAVAMTDLMVTWLPEDGSQHEGPGYWSFGHHWVARTVKLVSHVTGRDIVAENSHFTTAHLFRIYMTAPGWKHTLNIGDGGDGGFGDPTVLALLAAEAKDPQAAGVLAELRKRDAKSFYRYPAWGLLWHDAALKPRPYAEMPLWKFWPDIEMFSIRSSWDDDATALVFKCGPVGGHRMQKLRGDNWANVAHDHPDQNHFLLFAHGKMMAEDDGYPKKKKLTRSHNTITIDGKGQPKEGTGWQQPFPYEQTGYLDDVFLSHNSAYAAGNGSRLYDGAKHYVRHIAFVGGEYVISVDDLVGSGSAEHAFQWRLHKDGTWTQAGPGRFSVADGDVSLEIEFLSPPGEALTSEFLPKELTAKPCLAVTRKARATKFITVMTPRKAADPARKATLLDATGGTAVGVTGPEGNDLFAIASGKGAIAVGDVEVKGAAALVRRKDGKVQFALLTRGTTLSAGGKLILGASRVANVSCRREGDVLVVEAEAPYKAQGARTTLLVGGFPPRSETRLFIDGAPHKKLSADDNGVVTVPVDLSERHTIQFGGTRSVIPAARL